VGAVVTVRQGEVHKGGEDVDQLHGVGVVLPLIGRAGVVNEQRHASDFVKERPLLPTVD